MRYMTEKETFVAEAKAKTHPKARTCRTSMHMMLQVASKACSAWTNLVKRVLAGTYGYADNDLVHACTAQ